jgi:hypothetical protein
VESLAVTRHAPVASPANTERYLAYGFTARSVAVALSAAMSFCRRAFQPRL